MMRHALRTLLAATAVLLISVSVVAQPPPPRLRRPGPPPDRYAPILNRVRSLKHSPRAKVIRIGKSAEGRPVLGIILTSPTDPETIARGRTRVLFLCGQHGDEQSSVKAMLDLAEDLARSPNPLYRSSLERVVIGIVPVANPDGYSRFHRENGRGADLNRDWVSADQPETLAITKLVSRFRPQVIVDEHEWLDVSPSMDNCVEIAGFGRASQYKLQRLLAGLVRRSLGEGGIAMRTTRYDENADSGLAHRRFAEQGMCSFLVETSAMWSPEERVKVYRAFASALLVNLAFPPSEQVLDNLRGIANARKSADPTFAELYAPGIPALPTSVAAGCLAVFAVIACAVIRSPLRTPNSELRTSNSALRTPHSQLRLISLSVNDALELNLSPRMKAAVLRQYRRRPTDRQDPLRKPIPDAPVMLDPFENRALNRRWDSSIRRKRTSPETSRVEKGLVRDRVLARCLR